LDYVSFRETIGRVLWKREPSPESFVRMAQERLLELQTPNSDHHEVVDLDSNPELPIAFASWHVFRNPLPKRGLNASELIPDLLPERNRNAVLDFCSRLLRTEIKGGQPHIFREMLATHPEHQRRGAGEEADRLGLEVFVE
jgi:hypothetical protein